MAIESLAPSQSPVPAGVEPGGSWSRDSVRAAQPIASGELLQGEPSVTIEHEGTRYVLRATRAGKLILTK